MSGQSTSSSSPGWKSKIFAVRDVQSLIASTQEEGEGLKKSVGVFHLTAMGVGAIIGTGIFVVIGEGAAEAGPAVIVSFVLAALACVFSALSYAELASTIPVSGSAYTYSYATLGELVAWIIGWDLILEYGVSVAAIAVGWGGNLNAFLDSAFGFALRARESFQASLDSAVSSVAAETAGLTVTASLLVGNVVHLLSDLRDVDLLFCGSRGYGPMRRVLLGGVSSRLVRRASAPVVVVPRPG
jgi:basic amino acid/polyamine antiporter, APA family